MRTNISSPYYGSKSTRGSATEGRRSPRPTILVLDLEGPARVRVARDGALDAEWFDIILSDDVISSRRHRTAWVLRDGELFVDRTLPGSSMRRRSERSWEHCSWASLRLADGAGVCARSWERWERRCSRVELSRLAGGVGGRVSATSTSNSSNAREEEPCTSLSRSALRPGLRNALSASAPNTAMPSIPKVATKRPERCCTWSRGSTPDSPDLSSGHT
eukprot:4616299-Prymnesium_polylepis.1